MKILEVGRDALGFCAVVVMLAGCDVSPVQVGTAGALPQSPLTAGHAEHRGSWMLPAAKTKDLFYVSDQDSDDVYAYSWPGGQLKGTLTGFTAPSALCSDTEGDVYVTNFFSENILEYAHGGTSPTKTLKAPGEFPFGCAVDPATGDLAVANIGNDKYGAGDLLIYKKAKGTPKAYTDSAFFYWFNCGYDDKGNLFVDGGNSSYGFAFAELPKGSSALTNITINRSIGPGGGVQWNGKYVTVGNGHALIYEVQVSGSQGTVKGSTTLKGTSSVFEFWIEGTRVLASNIISFLTADGNAGIWNYPAGGKATTIIGGFEKPLGVTVSLAPK
jgi:DNA-binding beta-propeller fold protein YncE